MTSSIRCLAVLLFAVLAKPAFAVSKLEVADGWIRSAPPGATALAGYGTLVNRSDAMITIVGVRADGFAEASLHETIVDGDVSRMQPLATLVIEAGGSIAFRPGGKHIMLMQPMIEAVAGAPVTLHFKLADGSETVTSFIVRDDVDKPVDPHAGHEHHH